MPPGAITEGAPSGALMKKNVKIFFSNGNEQVQASGSDVGSGRPGSFIHWQSRTSTPSFQSETHV